MAASRRSPVDSLNTKFPAEPQQVNHGPFCADGINQPRKKVLVKHINRYRLQQVANNVCKKKLIFVEHHDDRMLLYMSECYDNLCDQKYHS